MKQRKQQPFCDKCGELLKIVHAGEANVGTCSCGFVKQLQDELTVGEKAPAKEERGTGVVKEYLTQGFPHVCKKCKHGWCEIHQLSASYSDESDICLYTCKKCGFTERETDGTSNM